MPFRIDAYLERIDYNGTLDVSAETLRGLHSAHVFHIPFENLDIHLGRGISLEPDAVFDKIVGRRRGGYCYEMNGLFSAALTALGFDVTLLLGRIIFGYEELRPRSHQLLLVKADGREWLCDTGYGSRGLLEPLPFQTDVPVQQYTDTYRLTTDPFFGYILQGVVSGEWANLVGFTLEPQHPVDYRFPNYWNSTSPDSNFVKGRMVAMPTPEGRMSLVNHELKIRRGGEMISRMVEDEAEYRRALVDYFGLVIDGDFVTPLR